MQTLNNINQLKIESKKLNLLKLLEELNNESAICEKIEEEEKIERVKIIKKEYKKE